MALASGTSAIELDRSGEKPNALIDPFGRAITYLRVSVTDRCDFRCVYCMSEHMTFLPKADLLSERWMPPPEGPVARVLSRKSGRLVAVVMTGDPMVESLTMRDVEITPGPGARRLDRPRHRQQR